MKNILIINIATLLFVSCDNKEKSLVKGTENEKLVRRYYEHFNKHEWSKMAEMYTPIADFKDPSLGTGIVQQTRKQIIEKYAALNAIFPNIKDEIAQIYPSNENHIIVEFISTGTALDSSEFTLPICTIFTIEKGLITKDFTYYDNFDDPK